MHHPIHLYHTEVEKIVHYGGTKNETALRTAFFNLLNDYAKQNGLQIIAELRTKTPSGNFVTPDGTLKDGLRQDWGYWESKDEADDLNEEIKKKFAKGYPKFNILFEDSQMAVLIQNGIEVLRCYMSDADALDHLLTLFVTFERPEVQNFRKAIELFKQDVPIVTETIRKIIMEAENNNREYQSNAYSFLSLCKESINPNITREDIREMIIQHILTEDIFNTIFDETQFHRENNIARELDYISNLNIEFTYAQNMERYIEFENLCFVDTLDNMGFNHKNKQISADYFSEENSKRIKKQNEKKIAVIIGNPPYNANQANENDNNKNREYPEIDKRIKDTFIYNSTAQKTKMYDMYARFYRWAFDRLYYNGIVAFVTNRSFIDSRTFDGFRKTIQKDFETAYIIDTLSDVRANPKIAGTTHNVFGIQTGVAIMFLIKKTKRENEKCKIHFEIIRPDKNNNWINLAENDFESLLPLYDSSNHIKSVFFVDGLGISTNRDEWVYDFNKNELQKKLEFFISIYSKLLSDNNSEYPGIIKWSRDLKSKFDHKKPIIFDDKNIIDLFYRPYTKKKFFANKILIDRLTENHISFFGEHCSKSNLIINVNHSSSKDFNVIATNTLTDLHYNGDTRGVPIYRYDKLGNCIDNITDWGLKQFVNQYHDDTITKQEIFHYVYIVGEME